MLSVFDFCFFLNILRYICCCYAVFNYVFVSVICLCFRVCVLFCLLCSSLFKFMFVYVFVLMLFVPSACVIYLCFVLLFLFFCYVVNVVMFFPFPTLFSCYIMFYGCVVLCDLFICVFRFSFLLLFFRCCLFRYILLCL